MNFDSRIHIDTAIGTLSSMRNLLPHRKVELAEMLATKLGAGAGDGKYPMDEIQAGLRKCSLGADHPFYDPLSDAELKNVMFNQRERDVVVANV